MRTATIIESWAHPSGKLVVLYEVREDGRRVLRDTVMTAVLPGESKGAIEGLIRGFVTNVALGLHQVNGIPAHMEHWNRPHSHALEKATFECKPPEKVIDPRLAEMAAFRLELPELREGEYFTAVDEDGVTTLYKGEEIVMNDHPGTVEEHTELFARIDKLGPGGSILMVGLGIGFVLKYALTNANISRIDVIEISAEVIKLNRRAGTIADKRVVVHEGDGRKLRLDGRWDLVWVDICGSAKLPTREDQRGIAGYYAKQAGWVGSNGD